MKKIVLVTLALAFTAGMYAQTSGVGIGARIGNSLDFTAKFWMSEKNAFAVGAGIDYWYYGGGFKVDGDFLIHNWTIDIAQDQMKVYFGPGVGVGFYSGWYNTSNVAVYLRAPGGVGYYFHSFPMEAFVDLVPTIDVVGPSGFNFRWLSYVGARWYF
jgi:hypothetical protein